MAHDNYNDGSNAATVSNEALTPLPASQRVFGWHDHASLWFSLGVGLLVMQIGAYLAPAVGTRDAAIAIVLGSCIGAGLLAWTARLGCQSGLASAGLMHATYGSAFARLPVLLNIVQLVGWTTFELVVMREGTQAIGQSVVGSALGSFWGGVLTTLLWGAVLLALLAGSMVKLVRRFVSRFGLPLVVLSLLWLTWQFATQLQVKGLDAFWARPGDGSMGMFGALDLVIAMPVSWLPLVADYARHGKRSAGGLGGAFGGTWIGYALANIWCYALGVMVVSVAEPGTGLVTALLLAQGGLVALGLILIDELDNAYGDVYSGSVSTHSLLPRWSVKRWGLLLAALCIALALVLPMHTLEPFLLLLSSVFVPLYGVIIGRLGSGEAVSPAGSRRKIDFGAALIWIAGIAAYHALAKWAPQFGSALPTLAATFVLAWLSRPSAEHGASALAQSRG
ncbi:MULTISPECIES: cytosine permease [unclassified Variovorax]|jgi:putative hydroxymethylpyrimidine transporter CytX|uniref:purine-cytosine permease family protein n=1 Tax=unclassified Variovorax TaxID=663243 RepID=UPI000F7DED54|nr:MULTISPECIES: cytosine permease [unclassified Variovorax]RSZ37000.1 allantoin permease [Variovorax sp. 553]RSZ37813.1 allantoin permease [Variovorax sp. 679]